MAFNPNQPFEVVEQPASAGGFDPSAPFEIVEAPTTISPEDAQRIYGEIARQPMAEGFAPIDRRIPEPPKVIGSEFNRATGQWEDYEEKPRPPGVVRDTIARLKRGAQIGAGQIIQGAAGFIDTQPTAAVERNRFFGVDGRDPVTRFIGDFGSSVERDALEAKLNPLRDNTLVAQVADVISPLAPIVATGGLGAAAAGGFMMGEQGARAAEARGEDAAGVRASRNINTIGGGLLNAVPALGVARANPAISRAAQSELARRGLRAGVGALEGAAVNTLGDAGVQLADAGYIDSDRTLANIAIGAGAGGAIGASMRSAPDAPVTRVQAAPELDIAAARNQYNQAIELETADALRRNLELQDQRLIDAQIADQVAARELARPEFEPTLEGIPSSRVARQMELEDAFSQAPVRPAAESAQAFIAADADQAMLAREAALVDAEMTPDIPASTQLLPQAQRVADEFEGQFSGSRSRQFRNRQQGSIDPAIARTLGGGAAGAGYGFATGETPEERLQRAAAFGIGGAALAGAAPAIGRALSRGDANAPRRTSGIELEAPNATPRSLREQFPDTYNSLPPNESPVLIRTADGQEYPASINGFYDMGNGDFMESVGRLTPDGWSHGMLRPGETIVSPIPTPQQWAQGVREIAPTPAPLALEASGEGLSIEPIGERYLVMEGVGTPEMQYQVRRPGEEGRGVTMTASQLREQGIPIPEAPKAGEAPAPGNAEPAADAASRPAADINFKLDEKPGLVSQATTKTKDIAKLAARGLDEYVGVMDTRVRNISPEAYGALQQYEFNIRNTPQKYKAEVFPFIEQANKLLNADDQRRLTVFLNNGDFDAVARLISDRGANNSEAVASTLEAFNKAQAVYQDLLATAQAAGIETGALDNYWHRQLDPRYKEEFLTKIGREKKGPIWEAVSQKAEQLGLDPENMSTSDRADITNQVLRGVNFAADGGLPGQFKARGITNTMPFEKYYLPYDQSALSYIDKTVRFIERKKLFGNGVDNAGSLGNAIERTRETSGLTAQQETDLRDMFASRFGPGERPSGPLIGGARAAMSMAYLGQFSDAITQVADFALNPGRYGFADSAAALVNPKEISIKDIGLDEIGQELRHTGKTAKLVDTVFATSGFKKVVNAAQNASLNTAIRSLRRMSRTPDGQILLANKYGRAFEGEFPQMLDDLQNGRITDNTKLLAFSELTNSQPITLSSMPQGYLDNPNGRILYAMKSFAIKSFDLFRREAIQNITEGRRQYAAGNKTEGKALMKRGVRNLAGIAAAYAIGSAITNSAKDVIAGRETDPEELAAGSLLGLVGLSRFDLQNLLRNGPGDAVRDKIMPAYGFGDELASFAMTGGEDDRIKQRLPWVGDLWYWHGESGREKEQETRDRRARENDPATQRRKEIRDMRKAARERE